MIHEDRLENEHIGNMDQYRVTREVPLPYTIPEEAEDDQSSASSTRSGLLGRLKTAKPPSVRLWWMDSERIHGAP